MSEGSRDDRAKIFSGIRRGLGQAGGGEGNDDERRAAVAARLAGHPAHLPLQRVAIGKRELTALFASYLQGQAARVIEVADRATIPTQIAAYLRDNNLPARLRLGEDPLLASLPWDREPGLQREPGKANGADTAGLSHATAGAAETGTMFLASGPDNPVTINFLPETHIVVIEEKDIRGTYEQAWEMIRKRFGAGAMPRTVNMISGPSRTADIAGILVRGAHGPRNMCVIIILEQVQV